MMSIQTERLGAVMVDVVHPEAIRLQWRAGAGWQTRWTTPAELDAAARQDWADDPVAGRDYQALAEYAWIAYREYHPRFDREVNAGWGNEPIRVRGVGEVIGGWDECRGHSPYAPMPIVVVAVGYGDGNVWVGKLCPEGYRSGCRVDATQAAQIRARRICDNAHLETAVEGCRAAEPPQWAVKRLDGRCLALAQQQRRADSARDQRRADEMSDIIGR